MNVAGLARLNHPGALGVAFRVYEPLSDYSRKTA